MKKILLVAVALLGIAALITGCSSNEKKTTDQAAIGKKVVLKVGATPVPHGISH